MFVYLFSMYFLLSLMLIDIYEDTLEWYSPA